jgi:hypothetical protein
MHHLYYKTCISYLVGLVGGTNICLTESVSYSIGSPTVFQGREQWKLQQTLQSSDEWQTHCCYCHLVLSIPVTYSISPHPTDHLIDPPFRGPPSTTWFTQTEYPSSGTCLHSFAPSMFFALWLVLRHCCDWFVRPVLKYRSLLGSNLFNASSVRIWCIQNTGKSAACV